jgi:ATP-binding protein involved in chromosome partitioning
VERSEGTGGGQASVADAVAAVVDPRLFHPLGTLGLVRSVRERRRSTEVEIAVPRAHPGRDDLVQAVREAVAAVGAPPAAVSLVELDEASESALYARLHELGAGASAAGRPSTAGPVNGPGHAEGGRHGADGPSPRPNPFADKSSRTRVLAIGSGKGGVGKSSVTVNLAVALAAAGHSTAVLDADVYGFSVPSMLGAHDAPTVLGDMLLPAVAHGVRCISMGFFVPEDQAVIWRGPMLHKALEQFLVDVAWGDPEFLLIDLPPGTGDVSLSIAQFIPRAELFVVTTPQPAAERVAQRAAVLARQLRLPLRGVVENMSFFRADDGTAYELFGSGGGKALADHLGVPLLAQIPLVQALRAGGDEGVPITVSDPDGEVASMFRALAARVASFPPVRVYRSELAVR